MKSSFKSPSLLAVVLGLFNLSGIAVPIPVDEDTSLSLRLLDFTRFPIDGKTSHGSISMPDPVTDFSMYVPDGNFSGTDSFTWISFSGGSEQNNTVTITVNEIHDCNLGNASGGSRKKRKGKRKRRPKSKKAGKLSKQIRKIRRKRKIVSRRR